jgi:nucleoside-diphosphate-sugar epimerase/biotin carboxylase
MKNGKYCIAITSIGSGIGQSIITSCNLSLLPLHTIGFDVNPFAFGAFECDEFEEIPSINSDKYLSILIDRCIYNNVDLIIPGLDDELLILAESSKLFNENGIQVLSSSKKLISLVRNKDKVFKEFSQFEDFFVKSYSLSQIKKLLISKDIIFPLIAKPLSGSSSEGVYILLKEEDLTRISDNCIIQEIAVPKEGDPNRETYLKNLYAGRNIQVSEISIQVVANPNGGILGRMMSCNKLKNGVPIEILPFNDNNIWGQIDLILPRLKELGHKGPLNIQGRLTDKGFKIYEMNARFTGITGLRAIMGFNEVEACIKKWLEIGHINSLKINYSRFGIRQVLDKVIVNDNSEKFKNSFDAINFNSSHNRKTVLVTGANGYLGHALIKRILKENYHIIAMGRSIEVLRELFKDYKDVSCVGVEDFYNSNLQLGQIDFLVHCAFARPHYSYEEIADSLHFTNLLFSYSIQHHIPAIINVSSQSVYGTNHISDWNEKDKPMPETSYAQAKYATELLIDNIQIINKHGNGTSIRLPALTGAANHVYKDEFLIKLIKKVICSEIIEVYGGTQRIDLLNVRDAADGIAVLLMKDYREWSKVYNLSTGKTHSLNEIIELICSIGKEKYDLNAKIKSVQAVPKNSFGMDSKLFRYQMNWKSKYKLEDTIKSIFDYLINLKE